LIANCSSKALSVLKTGNFSLSSNNLDDVAPTIYNKWVSQYEKTLLKTRLGKEKFGNVLGHPCHGNRLLRIKYRMKILFGGITSILKH
jgi:hypothetical protein